jgi:hypothetical protein
LSSTLTNARGKGLPRELENQLWEMFTSIGTRKKKPEEKVGKICALAVADFKTVSSGLCIPHRTCKMENESIL